MTPLDQAWHDFADAAGGCSAYEAFAAAWHARQADVDVALARRDTDANFWRRRIESADAERDRALMLLATTEYERVAFKRQRNRYTGTSAGTPTVPVYRGRSVGSPPAHPVLSL